MPFGFNKNGSRVVNQVLIQLLRSPDFYILLFYHLLRKNKDFCYLFQFNIQIKPE